MPSSSATPSPRPFLAHSGRMPPPSWKVSLLSTEARAVGSPVTMHQSLLHPSVRKSSPPTRPIAVGRLDPATDQNQEDLLVAIQSIVHAVRLGFDFVSPDSDRDSSTKYGNA